MNPSPPNRLLTHSKLSYNIRKSPGNKRKSPTLHQQHS